MFPLGELFFYQVPRYDIEFTSSHRPSFSWVVGSLFSVATLLQWQVAKVAGARMKARIPYPLGELCYVDILSSF